MRYHALISDYDGTLTTGTQVSEATINALIRLKATGRKLILVTGRELKDLQATFKEHQLFDCIVAENGAVIYYTATKELRLLGEPPPTAFIKFLLDKDIPLAIGRIILATWEPNEIIVLEAIKQFGLEHQVIFNKTAVMILPPGINKASGLKEALKPFNLSFHNIVAVGDAENDCAMFNASECAVAVANALPHVKDIADWTTRLPGGEGIVELIDCLIKDDLTGLNPRLSRNHLTLGIRPNGTAFQLSPTGNNVLLAGPSGCGKTTLTALILEKMAAKQYQFCVIDPEGDYDKFPDALYMGDSSQAPSIEQTVSLLMKPDENVIVCLLAIPLSNRPAYFRDLIKELMVLRSQTGHPHFIVIDEAHHVVPKTSPETYDSVFEQLDNFVAITTRPALINDDLLGRINMAMMLEDLPAKDFFFWQDIAAEQTSSVKSLQFRKGEVMVWHLQNNATDSFQRFGPQKLLTRHRKKYATGDIGSDSFYFRGPNGKIDVKASNLISFIHLASNVVDDETWQYHLLRHDFSKWIRHTIKNAELATATERLESAKINAEDSRKELTNLILEHYTASA
jgi:hydroxymethylpyrimidine pyrophosphatase-like HAD family hydrolase/energy-coupling factor transporter ATP-binding protein EcfA2